MTDWRLKELQRSLLTVPAEQQAMDKEIDKSLARLAKDRKADEALIADAQANWLAGQATEVAQRGGGVVGRVVGEVGQTLQGINDSSKKIANIHRHHRRHRLPAQHPGR